MSRSVIVSGARTPIGKFRGAFAEMSAVDLGAVAIREALVRSGVAPDQVDYVVMGQVIRAGTGQIHRAAGRDRRGDPQEVPALNVDKVCLSGTTAIALADQMIRAGEVDVVVAGGMESMTQAPYVLPGRAGGSRAWVDRRDGRHDDPRRPLVDVRRGSTWGSPPTRLNAELGVGRQEQDAWAARSHQRGERRLGARARSPRRSFRSRSRSAVVPPSWSTRDEGIRARLDARVAVR